MKSLNTKRTLRQPAPYNGAVDRYHTCGGMSHVRLDAATTTGFIFL